MRWGYLHEPSKQEHCVDGWMGKTVCRGAESLDVEGVQAKQGTKEIKAQASKGPALVSVGESHPREYDRIICAMDRRITMVSSPTSVCSQSLRQKEGGTEGGKLYAITTGFRWDWTRDRRLG